MRIPTRAALSLLVGSFASTALAAQDLRAVQIAEGLGTPTDVACPPGDPRLFVSVASGAIRIVEHGVLRSQPFLDLGGQVAVNEGLSSLAFHPDYEENGRFFVTYLDTNVEAWLVEYSVSDDPYVADPASANVLLGPYPQISAAHNWNCVRFGPDGKLYVATGDGGATHLENPAQELNSLNGKILRLDVDLPAPYIAADNPFVGSPGMDGEIWMYGLRQPWRISFDRANGDLYVADVGRHDVEEINYIPRGAPAGQNFGWRCHEGNDCTGFPGCVCDLPWYVPPVHLAHHDEGVCAFIGGAVYRGSALPDLAGRYVFADHCTGRVWSLRVSDGALAELHEHTAELAPDGGGIQRVITSIGVDADGELLLLDRVGGRLFRVGPTSTDRYCFARPNSSTRVAGVDVRGSASLSINRFALQAQGAVPASFGIFFAGERRVLAPLGDGLRCVGGAVLRLRPTVPTGLDGSAARAFDLLEPAQPLGGVTPGDTLHFQFWFRDAGSLGGFNTSDAISVTFRP